MLKDMGKNSRKLWISCILFVRLEKAKNVSYFNSHENWKWRVFEVDDIARKPVWIFCQGIYDLSSFVKVPDLLSEYGPFENVNCPKGNFNLQSE